MVLIRGTVFCHKASTRKAAFLGCYLDRSGGTAFAILGDKNEKEYL